jgi:hypothetical protein
MKYTFLTTLAIALFFVSSCDDGIEKNNINPNNPEVVPAYTVFNSATVEYTDFMRNAFNTGRLTTPWLQYWGQTSYADEDRFLYRETTAEGIYRDTYRVGTDLKKVIELNTNEETRAAQAAFGNNENQIAAARIMLAYIFHTLTDTFGDVPYYSYSSDDPTFQALKPEEFLSPVFADQQLIYQDLLKELRAASDQLVTSESGFTSGDNIYDGDATKWKKFANSLILRIANRLRATDAAAANTAIDAAISAGVITSNEDNAVQAYDAADATASPFWKSFIDRTDFGVTNTFINILKGKNNDFGEDPRLFEMAAPSAVDIKAVKENTYGLVQDAVSTNPDDYQGLPYAFPLTQQLAFTSYTFPSSKVLKPDYGEVLIEYAEVQFIISERNGFSQAEYEEGVTASMQKWGVDAADVTAFVSNLPPANEANVLNQKYVALYMQAHEAWAEYRRTGFPNLIVLPGETITLDPNQVEDLITESDPNPSNTYIFEPRVDIDEMPQRLRYPQILQTLNEANRSAAAQALGGDVITSPFFWDVD